jgi:uncharacterized membrane protein
LLNGKEDSMRRILDSISFVLLAVLLAGTGFALYGPHALPDKIPTHLDSMGQPDAWTTPSSYEVLPMIALIVYLALTVVAAYSSLAKHAAQADPEAAHTIEALILKLIVWIKAELTGFFLCIQFAGLHAARHPDEGPTAWSAWMWVMLLAMLVTVALNVTLMVRVKRPEEIVAAPEKVVAPENEVTP